VRYTDQDFKAALTIKNIEKKRAGLFDGYLQMNIDVSGKLDTEDLLVGSIGENKQSTNPGARTVHSILTIDLCENNPLQQELQPEMIQQRKEESEQKKKDTIEYGLVYGANGEPNANGDTINPKDFSLIQISKVVAASGDWPQCLTGPYQATVELLNANLGAMGALRDNLDVAQLTSECVSISEACDIVGRNGFVAGMLTKYFTLLSIMKKGALVDNKTNRTNAIKTFNMAVDPKYRMSPTNINRAEWLWQVVNDFDVRRILPYISNSVLFRIYLNNEGDNCLRLALRKMAVEHRAAFLKLRPSTAGPLNAADVAKFGGAPKLYTNVDVIAPVQGE